MDRASISLLSTAIAAVGAAFIASATFIEKGRARLRVALRSLDQLMSGWE